MSLLRSFFPGEVLRWFAFGGGAGIEISGPAGSESLRIAAARMRPGGGREVGILTIQDASHQTAGVWGTEYAAFLGKAGLSHVAATVVLPRRDVIVRPLALPGVPDKDLAAAIAFQIEGLHPYAEDDAVYSYARIPGTIWALVAITRRDVPERYANLFTEAGVKIESFTCSAAAVYSALRLLRLRSSDADTSLLAYEPAETGIEVYGESIARPVFSASFDAPVDRALSLAASELRLEGGVRSQSLSELLGVSDALPYAAALSSACPILSLPLNLLPEARRERGSRLAWVPSALLGLAVILLALGLAFLPRYENGKYLETLNAEISRLTPLANRSAKLDADIAGARARTLLLDEVRGRTKADMDVLGEMTRILAPPAWLNQLDVTRTQVTLGGEAPQAALLLQQIDASPLFENSEFTMAPGRVEKGEMFRIRTNREAGK